MAVHWLIGQTVVECGILALHVQPTLKETVFEFSRIVRGAGGIPGVVMEGTRCVQQLSRGICYE